MDGQDIMYESIFKIEKVKEEPDDFFEEANPIELVPPAKVFLEDTVLNEQDEEECKDLHKASTLKSVIKKEDYEDQLEPPVTVFLESTEVIKEEVEEERENSLAMCIEWWPIKTEETDERLCSPGK
ncbi:hypothetical protein R5R35_004659 [Gryllus longicercus]|uniref:Uncharacterized protein n=1 Tax=Gryllus longicercus TaxID=2509291 RepID=A0AAN9W8P4_9ORTH